MKGEKLYWKSRTLILPFFVAGISMIINIMIFGLSYETNDDFFSSLHIYMGYSDVLFSNFFLEELLCKIQLLIPSVNVWVWFLIFIAFASSTAVMAIFTYEFFSKKMNANPNPPAMLGRIE